MAEGARALDPSTEGLRHSARATELEVHEAEHHRSEQVRSALYRVAEVASGVEDMPAFYAEMHRIVRELVPGDNFYIALYDASSQTISIPYLVDADGRRHVPPQSEAGALGTGEPLLAAAETLEDPERRGDVEIGRAGLEHLRQERPGLVLLDLMMPDMDGFEFVRERRKYYDSQTIPIVVITATRMTERDRLQLDGYVERVLQKDAYSREELLAEVRDVVARHANATMV